MANRLGAETSPYLLQHKDNPVDWYPWGEEAFARAVAENKPVFLSIGYSSCHWCHVMAHESFENDEVADVLNGSFISIKVDREERPDIDEAYLTAVQAISGSAGWPASLFLTPGGRPFFAGTYFPLENRGDLPGFLPVCRQVAMYWQTKRDYVESEAAHLALLLARIAAMEAPVTEAVFDEAFVEKQALILWSEFDQKSGGFGTAPKFPPHTAIDFLQRLAIRPQTRRDLMEASVDMVLQTLEQMALGGIHDHVGGGFHRYTTDAEWHSPHFEKMLYDNALLLGIYGLGARCLMSLDVGSALMATAYGIADWIRFELGRGVDGIFASGVDADSEGGEGRYYTWKVSEIREALSETPDRAEALIRAYGLTEAGNFRDEATGRLTGVNVLHQQGELNLDFEDELLRLREVRSRRPRPALDNKGITSWNGLAITGYCLAGLAENAASVADAILDAAARFGELPHQITDGVPSGHAFLDDYAAFARALFDLSRDLESSSYGEAGAKLTYRMIELFWDEAEWGFFSTSVHHEQLFGRRKPVFDAPTPSGNAMALTCLLQVRNMEYAKRLVSAFLGWMAAAPGMTGALCAAALPMLDLPGADRPKASSAPRRPDLAATLVPTEIKVDSDGRGRAELVVSIPAGAHINLNEPPTPELFPTGVMVDPVDAKVGYPWPSNDVYEGEVRFSIEFTLQATSQTEEFQVVIMYQICSETACQIPNEKAISGVLRR